MALQTFFTGETAGTTSALNANFQYLLGLIQSAVTLSNATGNASGASTAFAASRVQFAGIGTAFGVSSAVATNQSGILSQSQAVATGASTAQAFTLSQGITVGSALSVSTAIAIGNGGSGSTAVATGSATDSVIGLDQVRAVGTAVGGDLTPELAISAHAQSVAASATGSSTAAAFAPAQTETAEGFILTLPSQTILASTVPGSIGTAPFNSFAISANPGTVTVNGTADATATQTVELYYHLHFVYKQDVAGNWSRWAAAGTWSAQPNPFPLAATESPEGTIVTTTTGQINASRTTGQAAPIAGPFDVWTLSANPGQVVQNGTIQTVTANVVELYYHNHALHQLNTGGQWFNWAGEVNGVGGSYPGAESSPIPASGNFINIAPQLGQNTNTTFVVTGTLQGYGTGGTSINLIPNSTEVGAASGSPGILPNGWTTSLSGVTQTIVGVGSADPTTGFPYIDIQLTGTPTGTEAYFFESPFIPISPAANYVMSSFIAMTGGTSTNIQGIEVGWDEYSSASAFLAENGNFQQTQFVTQTATPTLVSQTALSNASAANAQPFYKVVFAATGVAVNVTYRIAGVMFQTGTTVSTFSPTPVAPGIPTLQYSDNGGTYKALLSNANVTATTFSFVHPPIPTTSAAFVVSVRDSAITNVVGTSNAFQVSTPGVVTIQSITLVPSSPQFTGNQPAGTVCAQITVAVSGGTFTGGTLRVTEGGVTSTNFTTNASNQLVTAKVLAAGTYTVGIVATLAGAAGSPFTLAGVSVVGTNESPPGTSVTTVGPQIQASATPGTAGFGNTISINNLAHIVVNGVDIGGSGVTQLYYIGHTAFQFNGSAWFGPIVAGAGSGNSESSQASPIPVIAIAGSSTTATFLPQVQGGPAELVGPVSVTAGGTNVISITMTGTFASSFSLSASGTVAPTTNVTTLNAATGFLWTMPSVALPVGNYAITLTANIT